MQTTTHITSGLMIPFSSEKVYKGKDRIRITIEPVELDGVNVESCKYQVILVVQRNAQEELVILMSR